MRPDHVQPNSVVLYSGIAYLASKGHLSAISRQKGFKLFGCHAGPYFGGCHAIEIVPEGVVMITNPVEGPGSATPIPNQPTVQPSTQYNHPQATTITLTIVADHQLAALPGHLKRASVGAVATHNLEAIVIAHNEPVTAG